MRRVRIVIVFLTVPVLSLIAGNNLLMRMLYEVDAPERLRNANQSIVEVPVFWRYREHISLQHAYMSLQNQKDGKTKKKTGSPYPVLDLFLREVCGNH
jgi:hypothetical protein